MESANDWLKLVLLPGLPSRHKRTLVQVFGGPGAVFGASASRRRRLLGPAAARQLEELIDTAPAGHGDHALEWLGKPRAALVGFNDPDFPGLLNQIPDPPLALFLDGDPTLLGSNQVAVVGSRAPTPTGLVDARRIATQVCERGWTVTSGLALGVDAAAHARAMECGGRTVAVLGSGIDVRYPARNRRLFDAIADGHLLVSEFPPGMPAQRHHFPCRNRIISGLCRATVVVQARRRSGSLITARLAGEQGRDVFAVPGPMGAVHFEGCLRLIRDGAGILVHATDLMDAVAGPRQPVAGSADQTDMAPVASLDGPQAAVLDRVDYTPTQLDSLLDRCGLTMGQLSYILIKLESSGLVKRVPGGAYVRIDRV